MTRKHILALCITHSACLLRIENGALVKLTIIIGNSLITAVLNPFRPTWLPRQGGRERSEQVAQYVGDYHVVVDTHHETHAHHRPTHTLK